MASVASAVRHSTMPPPDHGDPHDEGGDVTPHAEDHAHRPDQADHAPPPLDEAGVGRHQAVGAEHDERHGEKKPAHQEEDADRHAERILS